MLPPLYEDHPIAAMTTLGIGGTARHFSSPSSTQELAALHQWARARTLPTFVLGGGSNLLVDDHGFDGVLIQLSSRDCRVIDEQGDELRLRVDAGMPWDELVAFCVAQGLRGVECMSGIPGTVGGAAVQNIGAYGQEVCDVIETVEVFDGVSQRSYSNDQCSFAYRHSRFKARSEQGTITAVTLRLQRRASARVAYAELIAALGEQEAELLAIREAVLAVRRRKSMLVDPSDPNTRSAGSFFVNPTITRQQHASIESLSGKALSAHGKGPMVKVSAAWLIEQAGFPRGYRSGQVGLSPAHALAIINLGSARATEVLCFARSIRDAVFESFQVELRPEPLWLGYRGLAPLPL
ncbi:MAG: UDP-N-acetylmuramate dehydrogenase [Myxococcota bacterium]|nr:UDP-N-acetylmuramate dehydrogenase [Myxococcota bacterium]